MFVTEKLKTFSWVNVGNPDHEDFEKLQTEYKIDEDTISDILDPDEQPRLEIEDDVYYLFNESCDNRLSQTL